MSLVTPDVRLTVGPFYRLPALPGIELVDRCQSSLPPSRPASTASSTWSLSRRQQIVSLEEGCFITRMVELSHKLAHWINTARHANVDCRLSVVLLVHVYDNKCWNV